MGASLREKKIMKGVVLLKPIENVIEEIKELKDFRDPFVHSWMKTSQVMPRKPVGHFLLS